MYSYGKYEKKKKKKQNQYYKTQESDLISIPFRSKNESSLLMQKNENENVKRVKQIRTLLFSNNNNVSHTEYIVL